LTFVDDKVYLDSCH